MTERLFARRHHQLEFGCAVGLAHRTTGDPVDDGQGGADCQHRDGGDEQRARATVAHPPQQEDAAECVRYEDVAGPDEVRVQQSDDTIPKQTPWPWARYW